MRSRKQPEFRVLSLLLTVVILGLSGCLKPPPPGVSVRAVTADLVFGVPPLPEPVAPPGFEEEEEEETTASPSPRPPSRPPVNTAPPPMPCPKAPDQTFPDEEADVNVKGVPELGLYAWRWSFVFPSDPEANIPEDFIVKGIVSTRETSNTSSLFTVSEISITRTRFYLNLMDFEVRQEGLEDDGIYLKGITRYENGDVSGTPERLILEPPVEYLPLPAVAGADISSAGVDPNTLAVLRMNGEIVRRERVDVCGTVIDSWRVEGTQDFISSNGDVESIKYNYSIATQFGGIIVAEHREAPRESPQMISDLRIARLSPIGPVPPEFGGQEE